MTDHPHANEALQRIGAQLVRLEAETKALYHVGVRHRFLRDLSANDMLVLVSLCHAARNARIEWEERSGRGRAVDRTNVESILPLLGERLPERKQPA